jgi:predicted AlkP superfamily phosphohydrolase/phosphomutase
VRTLAVGLDAADSELIFRWAAEGELPTLRSLLERGAGARLNSQVYVGPEGFWPTIVTGCLPGKHGTYNWRCIRPGTNQRVRTPSATFRKPFWAPSDADGAPRVLLLDVPYVSRSGRAGETAVLGWGQRGAKRHESWPEGLLERVTAEHGTYARGLQREHAGRLLAGRRQRATLVRMAERKTRLLSGLMNEAEWDVCCAVYFESHHAGHAFHRYLVPGSWGYEPRPARRLGTALRDVYAALDSGLAELIDAAGPDLNIVVFSGAGMRPNTNGLRVLDELMVRLGYRTPAELSRESRRIEAMRRAALTAIPRSLASRIRAAALSEATIDRHLERTWHESTDWARTRAYAESEPGHSYIRIAHPERGDRDELCEEIEAELRALTNADTGRPAISGVWRREHVTVGPRSDLLPDLFIAWTEEGLLRRVAHPRAGVIEEDVAGLAPSEHTTEGFVIAAGPGIRDEREPLNGHIVDIAPTLLALLGRPIPEDMDGKPLSGMMASNVASPRRAAIEIEDDPWRGH